MIDVALAFNFNIQRCEVPVGEEAPIVAEGYRPLLEGLLERGLKADLFISGYSTRLMSELDPELISLIRRNRGRSFSIGTYTYTHPVPQLLSRREFEQQLRRGLTIDATYYEARPLGFLPPEFSFTAEMAQVLLENGLQWQIVLADHLRRSQPQLSALELHSPCRGLLPSGLHIILVPSPSTVPGAPAPLLKNLVQGRLSPGGAVSSIEAFARQNPDALLVLKRDAETLYVDRINSGFEGTRKSWEEFTRLLSGLDCVRSVTIQEVIDSRPPHRTVRIEDHLGNTSVETFTAGSAQPLWELTVAVRDKLLRAEESGLQDTRLIEAWEHLLLSHNSDGRIGYWHSQHHPGEHKAHPSRARFVEEHLRKALELLEP